jgi:hypothetical protein
MPPMHDRFDDTLIELVPDDVVCTCLDVSVQVFCLAGDLYPYYTHSHVQLVAIHINYVTTYTPTHEKNDSHF